MRRPPPPDPQRGPPGVWTVDAVTRELKHLIERGFAQVSVEGEVISCRPSHAGHVYFTLKGQRANLPSVMFRSTAQRLPRALRDGDRVVCSGAIELYEPHGRYQLVVKWVRLGGEGELLAALEALKRKLKAEGLFDPGRKRPLPRFPTRIAVVTSPTGAAIRDVITSVHLRFPVPILVVPAPVQGVGAVARLIGALNAAAQVPDVDVIVLARGGGSLEDLWSFNSEQLARAVAACPTPVVSAVGHEIDTVLSDLVADARAATPTSVGELLVVDGADLRLGLGRSTARLGRAIRARLRHARTQLDGRRRALIDPRRLLRERRLRIDELELRMRHALARRLQVDRGRLDAALRQLRVLHPTARLTRARETVDACSARLRRAWRQQIAGQRARLAALRGRLDGLSPMGALDRGYAIVRREGDGLVVRSPSDVTHGDALAILVRGGTLGARVQGREDS